MLLSCSYHIEDQQGSFSQKSTGNRVLQAVISPYRFEIFFQKITEVCKNAIVGNVSAIYNQRVLIVYVTLTGFKGVMESPRVGVVRESMLHRPLLIKVRTDIDGGFD